MVAGWINSVRSSGSISAQHTTYVRAGDTFFKFACAAFPTSLHCSLTSINSLHLRQRLIEETIINAASEEYGIYPKMLHQIEGYTIDQNDTNTHPVMVRVRDMKLQTSFTIKWSVRSALSYACSHNFILPSRYLVGADASTPILTRIRTEANTYTGRKIKCS